MRTAGQTGFLGALCGLTLLACASLAGIDDPVPTQRQFGTGEQTTDSGVKVSPQLIPIGDTKCEEATVLEQDIKLSNPKDEAIKFVITAPEDSPFSFRADKEPTTKAFSGEIKAGSTSTVKLVLDKRSALRTDTRLTVKTGEDTPIEIEVSAKVTGAHLVFNPERTDFGNVRKDGPIEDKTIEITNDGNEPATVLQWLNLAGTEFEVTSRLPLTVESGQKVAVTGKLKTGAETSQPLTEEITVKTATVPCGGIPKVSLSGKRINFDVALTGAPLNFTQVSCNSSPAQVQSVNLHNFAPKDARITAVTVGSAFGQGSFPEVLPAGGDVQISFSVAPPGPTTGARNDTAQVQITDGDGISQTFPVGLSVNVVGATLTLGATDLNFNNNGFATFAIQNSGNQQIDLAFNRGGTNPNEFNNVVSIVATFPAIVTSNNTSIGGGSAKTFLIDLKNGTPAGSYSTVVTTSRAGGAEWCNAGSINPLTINGSKN